MKDFFQANRMGRLFALVSMAFAVAGTPAFAQNNTGFFFGAGGGYSLMDAGSSMAYGNGDWENKFQQAAGAFLLLGVTAWRVDVGFELGYEPKVYYVGVDADLLEQATFSHIPMYFRIGYSSPGTLRVRPALFGGMALDMAQAVPDTTDIFGRVTPGRPAAMDWRIAFGGSLDLAYSFPGDHIALFGGVAMDVLIPLFVSDGDARLYYYPILRGGVLIHPFAKGNAGNSRGRGGSSGGYGSPRPSLMNGGGGGGGGGGYGGANMASSYNGYGRAGPAGGYYTPPPEPSSDNELLANLRMAEEETKARQSVENGALMKVAQDDLRRLPPAADNKMKKDLESHLAQVSQLKNEIREQRTELASVGFLEEASEETLSDLKKATRKVKTTRLGSDNATPGSRVDTVYFFPDVSSPMMMYSLPIVDEIGLLLQEHDDYVVAIRGYSAPAGTASSQVIISESRARYCAEYLNKNYGIAYDRMTIEWFGAQKKSGYSETYNDTIFNRAVELVTRSKTGEPIVPEIPKTPDNIPVQRSRDFTDPSVLPSLLPPSYGDPDWGKPDSIPPDAPRPKGGSVTTRPKR